MIIRSLRAEGFMRYELLELSDLPRGVIGVTGENEAGKSTIGEAIAFALFGRSVRTEATDPAQAIHWEHDACATSIEVEIPQAGLHRIERRVSRRGDFEATLSGPDGATLAEGPQAVGEALVGLLGFDFPIFRYSFYVAQHELDLIQRESQDNARRIVADMLGISTIERAAEHLREEREEMRERGLTLDRDLAVAKALYTEMLPLREELDGIEERVSAAEQAFSAAEEGEAQARAGQERAALALEASSERADALQRLGVALFASVHRRALVDGQRRLQALSAELTRLAGGASGDARERARGVSQQAETLRALVEARRGQLERELDAEGGPDAVPARIAAQQERIDLAAKSVLRRTLLAVFALLLTLAAGGGAAATRLPAGQPALTFAARELYSPRLNVTWNLSPEGITLPLSLLGGLLALGFVLSLVARGRASKRREEGVSERGRLEELQRQRQSERDTCAAFELGALSGLAAAVEGVQDPQVGEALERLRQAAGELMSSDRSPAQLLSAANTQGRAAELNARVSGLLEDLQVVLSVVFPDGLPEAPEGEQSLPEGLDALETEVDRLGRELTKARVELEVLRAEGAPASVSDAVPAAQAAFNRAFQALGEEEASRRKHYTEQTGLSQLLKAREQAPSIEDMRAVLQREQELGREIFGEAEALRAACREAEAALESARAALGLARAERDEALGRQERLATDRRRLEQLEARIGDLAEVVEPMQRQVDVHSEAITLCEDLAQALRARFGPGIERYVELVLPKLTQGRYRRSQVGDDLDIRIYSPERGDFVRLIELSQGTADQVLLALRLGLARALIGSRGIGGGHFLFLDEPLVSADEAREQAFLDLLRTFDEEFAQIFVSSPRPMSADLFTQRIELSRDAKVQRLEAGAKA